MREIVNKYYRGMHRQHWAQLGNAKTLLRGNTPTWNYANGDLMLMGFTQNWDSTPFRLNPIKGKYMRNVSWNIFWFYWHHRKPRPPVLSISSQYVPSHIPYVFSLNMRSNYEYSYLVKASIWDYLKSSLDQVLVFHPPLWLPLQWGHRRRPPPL